MRPQKYNSTYKIYKPNTKDKSKGAASQWEHNQANGYFMLTIAKQSGEVGPSGKPFFAWKDDSATIKLGANDLAEILMVLSGRKNYLGQPDGDTGKGIFHKNAKGNKILQFYKYKDYGYALSISSKEGSKLFRASHIISPQEAMILQVIISNVIWDLYNRNNL